MSYLSLFYCNIFLICYCNLFSFSLQSPFCIVCKFPAQINFIVATSLYCCSNNNTRKCLGHTMIDIDQSIIDNNESMIDISESITENNKSMIEMN